MEKITGNKTPLFFYLMGKETIPVRDRLYPIGKIVIPVREMRFRWLCGRQIHNPMTVYKSRSPARIEQYGRRTTKTAFP